MKKQSWISFGLLYLSWVLGLSLLMFWMQSQYVFLDVVGGNLMLLVFGAVFMLGCLYFLRYFKSSRGSVIIALICLWILSYLLIEGLSILFYVTLDKQMIQAIGTSSQTVKEILGTLWANLPLKLWEMVTLSHASHFLDLIYTVLIELGFLSPLVRFIIKKDCTDNKKCV